MGTDGAFPALFFPHITKRAHVLLQGLGAKLHSLLAVSTQVFEAGSRSVRWRALPPCGLTLWFLRVAMVRPGGESDERRRLENGPSIRGFRQRRERNRTGC